MNGYFKLTRDVKNPKADRRSKRRLDCAEVWKAGTVVFIRDTREMEFKDAERIAGERLPSEERTAGEPRGYILFSDNTQIHFNLAEPASDYDRQYPELRQGNDLVLAAEPAQRTLGQVLKDSNWNARQLLALLIDTGKITLADVDALKNYDLTPGVGDDNWKQRDAADNEFCQRHEI